MNLHFFYVRYSSIASFTIIQCISYIRYILRYNILTLRENSFRTFKCSFFLSFLRFFSKISFEFSILARSSSCSACTRWRTSHAMCNAHELRRFVELDREKRLWERYECNGTSRWQVYAVAVRRGSCFIPVIRRLSRGLYLLQLLGSGVNHSKLFLRLLFDIQRISSRSKGKSSRKKEKGRGRWGPFHQVSSVAVTRSIFARFKAAFAAKPNIVHYSVFYLTPFTRHLPAQSMSGLEISINPIGILSVRNIPIAKGERTTGTLCRTCENELAPPKKCISGRIVITEKINPLSWYIKQMEMKCYFRFSFKWALLWNCTYIYTNDFLFSLSTFTLDMLGPCINVSDIKISIKNDKKILFLHSIKHNCPWYSTRHCDILIIQWIR